MWHMLLHDSRMHCHFLCESIIGFCDILVCSTAGLERSGDYIWNSNSWKLQNKKSLSLTLNYLKCLKISFLKVELYWDFNEELVYWVLLKVNEVLFIYWSLILLFSALFGLLRYYGGFFFFFQRRSGGWKPMILNIMKNFSMLWV